MLEARKNKGNKEKKQRVRNEDSINSFEAELNNSESLEDNSIIEMFNYLERRYKKDDDITPSHPKQRKPEEQAKLPIN